MAPAKSVAPAPSQAPAAKRRRSSANLNEEAKRAARDLKEVTITRTNVDAEVTQQIAAPPAHAETPAQPKRRGRASKPAAEEVQNVTPPAPPVAPIDASAGGPPTARLLTTDEMDQWPTQSLSGDDDLEGVTDERTRIGARAYVDAALAAAAAEKAAPKYHPELQSSQAIRVVVWRSADGVHVAPFGTQVNAISVEAMLVALDPSADLAAWLKQS
jgi:hypothetical protein